MNKWITWGIVGLFVLVIVFSIGIYNRMISMDQQVKQSWAQVENQYQRRFDLIPNLVESVKGYKIHEKEVLTHIADARAKLAGAGNVSDKVKATNELEGTLSRLLVVVENYPQLKADANFRQLMDALEGTENRIAVERMRYNEAVQTYNISARRFPNNLLISIFGFDREKAFFESAKEAKAAPKVKF